MSTTPDPLPELPHFLGQRKKPGPPPGFRKGVKKSHHKPKPSAVIAQELRADGIFPSGPTIDQFMRLPDDQIRHRYATFLNKNEALFELGRLRKISEIASTALNRRLVPDEAHCMICKVPLPIGHKVAMMVNLKDDNTGLITTHPLCSLNCVREYNKFKMGMAAIPDRGMVDGQEKS